MRMRARKRGRMRGIKRAGIRMRARRSVRTIERKTKVKKGRRSQKGLYN